MGDNIFDLLEQKDNGDIIKIKYRSSWLLIDYGYLNWGNTIAPKNLLSSKVILGGPSG